MGEYSPSSFWDYSVKELYEIFESYNRRIEAKFKEKLILNHLLARQIGDNIAALLDKENKIPHLWDYYPELFEKEKEAYVNQQKEQAWKVYKAKMEAYMSSKGVR